MIPVPGGRAHPPAVALLEALAAWVWIPEKIDDRPHAADGYGAFIVTATAFFMAEMGDKTQIVALALAAKYHNLIAVVTGTTIGMRMRLLNSALSRNCVRTSPKAQRAEMRARLRIDFILMGCCWCW